MASDQPSAGLFGTELDPSDGNLERGAARATEAVVRPLLEYIDHQLVEQSDVLYLLERYARRVEWFEQERLFAEYEANPRRGEQVYDRDLRSFLFSQGIDYPFSQPRSASGSSDVVANLEDDDPLVCEIKLFDADRYHAAYLAQGVQQAAQYARDFGKVAAYLVVINLSLKHLRFESDAENREWPPEIHVGDVTVFIVQVRAKPAESASRQGRPEEITITKAQLLTATEPAPEQPDADS